MAAILAAGGVGLGLSAALDQRPDVEVVEQDPSTTPPPRTPGSGGGAAAPAAPAQTATGTEQTAGGTTATTTAGTTTVPGTTTGTANQTTGVGNPNGCVTPQPGVGWTCQNGAWYAPGSSYVDPSTGQPSQPGAAASPTTLNLPGFPSATVTGYPGVASAPAGGLPGAPSVGFIAAPGAANCMTTPPGLGMTCQNGVWVATTSGAAAVLPSPLNSPDVPMSGVAMIPVGNVAMVPVSNVPMSTAPGAPSPIIGLNAPCPMPQPAGNVVCQNGVWLNVGLNNQAPIATPSCTGAAPGPDYSCVNGVWMLAAPDLPNGRTSLPGASPPPAAQQIPCPAPSPGANFVCVNGNWVNR